jgi:hypothetical protein
MFSEFSVRNLEHVHRFKGLVGMDNRKKGRKRSKLCPQSITKGNMLMGFWASLPPSIMTSQL